MSTKVSVSALGTADKDGWLTKQGGKIKTWRRRWFVLKGDTIYYFKTQKDTEQTGEIKLLSTSACNPEPAASKKGKYRFSVGTPNRVYLIHCDTEKGMQQWVDKISKTIDNLSGGSGGGNSKPIKEDPKPGENNNNEEIKKEVVEKKVEEEIKSTEQTNETKSTIDISKSKLEEDTNTPTNVNTDHLQRLLEAKKAIPFLDNEESKVLEFWTIWAESIPTKEDMDGIPEGIEFQLATSAGRQKLTWRAAGPQNAFIQKMVDFFWNVGAPETEIDKLNDVGALINPNKIGSWIDMSAQGGMDGGWYFPVANTVKLALAAGDSGDPTTMVLEWAQKHNVEESFSVGRDMGAAPPRQTEIFLTLPGSDVNTQIEIALDAFAFFKFPEIPSGAQDILKSKSNCGICLSIITSAEGFVRLGILVPNPSTECVDALCEVVDAEASSIHQLEEAVSSKGPSFVEYQHLNFGFGYGVYNEGFDVVFHYNLSEFKSPAKSARN